MGIRRVLSLSIVTAMVMILLCSCGADAGNAAYDMDYNYKAEADGLYDGGFSGEMESVKPSEAGSGDSEATVQQKLIKTVDMSVETEDLTALLQDLDAQIGDLDGYVESRNVYNGSKYGSSGNRSADLTVRIPAANLEGFVNKVQGLSNIISTNERVEDVTLTYVAVESRVEALETERDRLMELMEQAVTMSDLLEVEARLTDVLSELEMVTSQLRVLQNQVDYATVELYIREVKILSVVDEESVWQRMTRGFAANLRDLGNGLVEFFVFLVVSLPYLVPLGGVAVLAVVLVRRSAKRKKLPENPPFKTDDVNPEKKD